MADDSLKIMFGSIGLKSFFLHIAAYGFLQGLSICFALLGLISLFLLIALHYYSKSWTTQKLLLLSSVTCCFGSDILFCIRFSLQKGRSVFFVIVVPYFEKYNSNGVDFLINGRSGCCSPSNSECKLGAFRSDYMS
jgi:hypothetical protein